MLTALLFAIGTMFPVFGVCLLSIYNMYLDDLGLIASDAFENIDFEIGDFDI